MHIIDENFDDASIYLVKFHSKKNGKEYFREILVPCNWNENQVGIYFKEIFNETVVVDFVNWTLDVWVPKTIFLWEDKNEK